MKASTAPPFTWKPQPLSSLRNAMVVVGVLALQGDVAEHKRSIEACGAEAVEVRRPADLERVDGLIIPGGESTTIGKLLNFNQLFDPIRQRIASGMPTFGTCAGAILLARDVLRQPDLPRFGALDIQIERNAYGAQVDSFESRLPIPELGDAPLPITFIRAPVIHQVGSGVRVLAKLGEQPVLVQSGHLLAATFHSELSDDARLHSYFVKLISESKRPLHEASSTSRKAEHYIPVYQH
eukprot:tig00020912_g15790.t1